MQKIEVVSLGVVHLEGSPVIHYPPGHYQVESVVAEALRGQGVLAVDRDGIIPLEPVPDASLAIVYPPAVDGGPGRNKGKGA